MTPLYIIIGMLAGWYAKEVYRRLDVLYKAKQEEHQAKQAGVIRPTPIKATRSQPIDLTSQTGGIMRLTPEQHALARQKERDAQLKSV